MTSAALIDVDRLQGFLHRAAPLLEQQRSAERATAIISQDRMVSEAQLAATLGQIAPALRQARQSGALANPWTLAGLKRDEVRTASVLAWLLDPEGSHGAGAAFASALWARVDPHASFTLEGLHRAVTEQRPLGDQQNRVDLVLEGPDFLVFIEVKIDAPLRERQLEDYQVVLDRKAEHFDKRNRALALLSLVPLDIPPGCLRLSWRDVSNAVRAAAKVLDGQGHDVRLARAFADHVDGLN